ncbi:hypothetical protein COCNU_scaffold015454G000060 [Cocos nucifera]|nr:hypothetical protein [Cocos nucifera]
MGKNKVALISLSLVILVAGVAAVAVTISHLNGKNSSDPPTQSSSPPNTSMKAIKAVCQPTDYKDVCEQTLSSMSHNTTDPMELVNVAFNASMKYVTDVFDRSEFLKEVSKDPSSAEGLHTCRELLELLEDPHPPVTARRPHPSRRVAAVERGCRARHMLLRRARQPGAGG